MTQREIAKGLRLTPQRVGQLAAKGMPTTSIEDARQWRKRHVDTTRPRTAESRQAAGRPWYEPEPAPPVPTGEGPGYGAHGWGGWFAGDELVYDITYCTDCINALGRQVERYGDAWLEPLREAMLLAPPAVWRVVDLDAKVWRALTGNPKVTTRRRADGPFTVEMAQRYVDACRLREAVAAQDAADHDE